MAEGSCPQVFVIDHPINSAPPSVNQKPLWRRARKSLVWPLFGLIMFGLILEAIFIYRLFKRTESYSHLQNQSNSSTPALDGHIMGRVGTLVSNEVLSHPEEFRGRPMAHLQGSHTVGKDGVVEWATNDEGFNHSMDYNTSGLVIKTKGFYYLYSKVHFQEKEKENCAMVNHKVIKNTTMYGLPIDLLKSKSLYCRNERPKQKNPDDEMDLRNSFLAGVFKLETGDHIYVTLDKELYPGPADNFFGAFMLS